APGSRGMPLPGVWGEAPRRAKRSSEAVTTAAEPQWLGGGAASRSAATLLLLLLGGYQKPMRPHFHEWKMGTLLSTDTSSGGQVSDEATMASQSNWVSARASTISFASACL